MLRAEQQGDDDARSDATLVHTRLLRAAAALPSVQERAARHARCQEVEERIDQTLAALRDGSEDIGRRYDLYGEIRRFKDAGVASVLRTAADGTPTLHAVRGAGEESQPETEKWVSTPDR